MGRLGEARYLVSMVSIRILRDVVLVSKLVVLLVLARARTERFSTDFLVIRDDRFATVQIAVHVSPGYSFHSHRLSVHSQISVLLHAVSVRLFPRFVLQRLQWVASVDALHRRLPSFVEHLPHLREQMLFLRLILSLFVSRLAVATTLVTLQSNVPEPCGKK